MVFCFVQKFFYLQVWFFYLYVFEFCYQLAYGYVLMLILLHASALIVCLCMSLYYVLGTDHLTWWGVYGFLFRSENFFRTTQELGYLFFLLRKARNFFPEFNIRLYVKTLNQIFFFPPPKSEYFFQQHWESEYFFKLNGRSLMYYMFFSVLFFRNCDLDLWSTTSSSWDVFLLAWGMCVLTFLHLRYCAGKKSIKFLFYFYKLWPWPLTYKPQYQ